MTIAQSTVPGLGHNSAAASFEIEVRFFNSLARFTMSRTLSERIVVPVGTTVGDLIERFRIPLAEIFLVLRNGRDVTAGVYQGGVVNLLASIEEGDVVAFSGPVPYSFGYGAPVV